MKFNKRIILSLTTGIIVFASLYLSIIVKLGNSFDIKIATAYLFVSLFISLISYILNRFKILYASEMLLLASIISGLFLYISMPKTGDGFLQLGAIMGWFMILAISIAILLVYAMIALILRYTKKGAVTKV